MMDKEKLRLIIKNLESLVDCLKSEVYSDVDPYKPEIQYEEVAPYIDDYDEVFYDESDDELFNLMEVNQKYKIANNDDGGKL
jgi:hypothetical protein